ncbi:MAG: phosphoserine phosphatase SerB [Actinomycetota bacterium]|nr:phosphoserine phosphatase SerB [Actinomycetota bacterium]
MARFLVVLDVDSTLIEDEVIELLAAEAGSHDEVAEITRQAMNGLLDFSESLRARVATLEGLPVSLLETVGRRIRVTDGVPGLVSGVHEAGGAIGVVSGGFHELLDPLAERLGLDYWRANRLGVDGDALDGTVDGAIVDAATKADTLREWAADAGVDLSRCVAVGDGANDMPMMKIAGLSVAFDAKAPVRDCADVVMDVRDLTQVLPLLGLPRE